MSKKDYIPRMSIALSEEQHLALQRLIPWGIKNQIYKSMTDELIRILTEEGFSPVERLMAGKATLNIKVN